MSAKAKGEYKEGTGGREMRWGGGGGDMHMIAEVWRMRAGPFIAGESMDEYVHEQALTDDGAQGIIPAP
eukprot:CAMPEP_0174322502 /NCGR_PEP_ID=MMETSP0810-20121108/11028_1 /TAXON_ID=73025 ORGANISM="Eutreptiella gymnastica-like, Strain CCMP1594" /NCGR_SAMPLE_ID=MMETSP0810 /ASSEMBLY_ACC=CAM_ASM_000659 /LENGTH=68 /DNA_ID=CAMNT_0015434307 /DNA_START=379 /DNA_END=585 /DNA_ORIENTATION=-